MMTNFTRNFKIELFKGQSKWQRSFYVWLSLIFLTLPVLAQTGLDFNGTNQYMTIAPDAGFNYTNSESFSVTAWVKVVSSTGVRMFASNRSGGSGFDFYQQTNNLKLDIADPYLQGYQTGVSANLFTFATWHHIGFVYNGTTKTLQIYQNGVASTLGMYAAGTDPRYVTTQSNTYGNKITVFAKASNTVTTPASVPTTSFTPGTISTLRFWNKALNATEMAADMTSTVTSSTSNLIAAYDFNVRQQDGTDIIVPNIVDPAKHKGILKNFTASILPIILKSFTAKGENAGSKLEWSTATEANNKEFVIYRSGDDKVFAKIGSVKGSGTSSVTNQYQYYDRFPLNGNNYYRLVQIDNDGEETELGIKLLKFSLQTESFNFYPNPTKDKVTVEFEKGKFSSLTLLDITGKTLQTLAVNSNDYHSVIDLSTYKVGTYFLKLEGRGNFSIKQIVKQ